MSCPLYKSMKTNGTSFYAFPGASEDIASTKNNPNLNFYFSHYVLLNIPKQNFVAGSQRVCLDFDNAFYKLDAIGQEATTFKDQLIESLRNYVANHEVTIRESRLNNTEFYYDSTELPTTAEKIFFKWCRKLGLLELEQAVDGDEYFGNLIEFERNNITDDAYFPEVLWKERQVTNYSIKWIRQSTVTGYTTKIMLEFDVVESNYKVGDYILLAGLDDGSNYYSSNNTYFQILGIVDADTTYNQQIAINVTYTSAESGTGYTRLVYHKLIQYIGNINGVNNVQEANRTYQEVWAHVPAHTGQTPDILFRTRVDRNYKPNMLYPILPGQYQPEILGAELFNSPIVSNPQNYPGNYYGQYDSEFEYTYRTSDGDSIRRSGDYFGFTGDINTPVVSSTNLDGISLDFDYTHYVKMNIIDNEMTTFEQFNAMMVNNLPPQDFEFNAILWYYTLEDNDGNTANNLYGISLLDNPDNNPIEAEQGLRIAPYKKLVATDNQDGTAYAFSLNLNYNIINDNPQDTFNPSAINSLFSFNLFNEAMTRLAQTNDSFNEIIAEQNFLKTEMSYLKQLIYTQGDFANINTKLTYLEGLLTTLQSMQIESSDTIEVTTQGAVSGFPRLKMENVDTAYYTVYNLLTTQMYNDSGIVANRLIVPKNKDFLVNIINNDTKAQTLANNDKLTVYLEADLYYRQSVDINITSTDIATQNKQIEFYINYNNSDLPVLTKAIGPLDFPIYYNTTSQTANLAAITDSLDLKIDLTSSITLSSASLLTIPLLNMTSTILENTVKKGDTFLLENMLVGTSSTVDFSGQYIVDSTSSTNIILDLSTNVNVTNYVAENVIATTLTLNTKLVNIPSLRINRGHKYRITRLSTSETDSFENRYLIQKL